MCDGLTSLASFEENETENHVRYKGQFSVVPQNVLQFELHHTTYLTRYFYEWRCRQRQYRP